MIPKDAKQDYPNLICLNTMDIIASKQTIHAAALLTNKIGCHANWICDDSDMLED